MTSLLIFLTSGLFALFWLSRLFTSSHDPKEPPLIPSGIPVVGHIYGILRYGSGYYYRISSKFPGLPIYSLGVPGSKIYIVTDTSLVQAVDRRPKTFSFTPIVLQFATRFLTATPESVQKLATEEVKDGSGDSVGLAPETLKTQHEALAPGAELDRLTQSMLASISRFVDSRANETQSPTGLFNYFGDFATIVSTDAIYGQEKNPYRESGLIDALKQINRDFSLLGLNFYPSILAPKGNAARNAVFAAMGRYYTINGQESASRLIRDRLALNRKYNVPQRDIDHFDLAISFGLLANAPPSMFWMMYYLYSDTSLLSALRSSIETSPTIFKGLQDARQTADAQAGAKSKVTVNICEVMDDCPLLESFFNEVIRVQSTSATVRVVTEDTMLAGSYLLKKGSFIMIPSEVVHRDEKTWGPTASQFDASRFVRSEDRSTDKSRRTATDQPRVPMFANRSWGGGVNLCPGRNFATRELLSILVIMALKFDIRPTSSQWRLPKTKRHMISSIMEPVEDIPVWIRPRKDRQHVEFSFIWCPRTEAAR